MSSQATDLGNWLERPLVEWAGQELGFTPSYLNLFRVSTNPLDGGILSATYDGWGRPGEAVEAKYVGLDETDEWGESGTDEVPPDVLIQVQQQAYVADLHQVIVAAAFPRYRQLERRLYFVPRNDELIAAMVPILVEWWKRHIVAMMPPDPESAPPLPMLKALRREPAKIVKVNPKLITAKNEADIAVRVAKQTKERADAALLYAMGDAEIADGGKAGGVTYKLQNSSPATNYAKLRADGLYEKYCSQGQHRTLRYVKPKQGD